MNILSNQLNKDQFDGLANLCFDLAKAAFIVALLPTTDIVANPWIRIINIATGIFIGFAFSYLALVLLKLKELTK